MPSINILGGIMHYEDRGEGFPLVFLHGFGLDHRNGLGMLEPVFAGRHGWRRLYPDMPGAGKTQLDANAVSADEYLHVVEAFVDTVIPGQRFAVVGLSYGGYIARGLLFHRLGSVGGIALVVPCVIPERTKRHVASFRVMEEEDNVLVGLDPKDQAEIRESLVVITSRTVARFKAEILAAVRDSKMPLLERMQATAYAFSFDVDALLPIITCPALILTGRMDNVVGFADSFSLLHKLPRATHVVLDTAGHSLELDQESIVTRILGNWIDRVAKEEGVD